MKNADIRLLKSSFADSVIFQTIIQDKQGNTIVKNESTRSSLILSANNHPALAMNV
jgi:hypothetical protein